MVVAANQTGSNSCPLRALPVMHTDKGLRLRCPPKVSSKVLPALRPESSCLGS